MKKKILSAVPFFAMVSCLNVGTLFSAMPITAFAAETSYTITSWSALQDPINAAPGDATTPATETTTIQLTGDLTAPAEGGATITVPAGKNITLDLNGKVLNADGKFNAITIAEGGKLTVIDSTPTTEHYFTVGDDGLWTLTATKTENTKTVKGGIITGGTGKDFLNNGTDGGGVYNNGMFNMTAGNIIGNKATATAYEGLGGGVYNTGESSTFTMSGGTISGNKAKYGGGVANWTSTFTMSGGTISGNKATNGGGVYNIYESTFTMSGGTISDNEATEDSGGVDNNVNSTFTMSGGTISGNKAKYGGAVCNYATFIMSGSTVSDNEAEYGGAVYNCVTFTMSGSTFSGNKAKYGGGVYNTGESSAFTMTDGTFSDNEAEVGGGVYNRGGGTFTMSGGTFSGNKAGYGGGVYNIGESSTFTMTDGTFSDNEAEYGGAIQSGGTLKLLAAAGTEIKITDNTATVAEGGIANFGPMHLSGKVIIKNNICNEKYDSTVNYPINLATDREINIDGALTGSEIYITHINTSNDQNNAGVLTSGFKEKNPDAGLNDFFHYDGPSTFYMNLNTDGEYVDELEVKAVPSSSHSVSIPSIANGKITADKYVVDDSAVGDARTVTLTVTPDAGYQLVAGSLKLNGSADGISDNQDGTYSFDMPNPAVNVTVTAEFELAHVHAIKTTYAKIEAKCEEAGHETYYECDCGKYFSDQALTQEIENLETWLGENGDGYIAPIGHDMTQHTAIAPTCTEDGTVEYWTCSRESGVYYANEQGTSTLTSIVDPKLGHDIDKVNGTPATEGADGFKDAYKCNNCGKYFEDEAGTKLIGDEAAYNAWKLAEGKIPALDPQKENGLSGGAIAGIVIGIIFGLLIILFAVLYILWKRKNFNVPFLCKVLTPVFRFVTKLLFKTKLNNVEAKDCEDRLMEEEDYLKALKDKSLMESKK